MSEPTYWPAIDDVLRDASAVIIATAENDEAAVDAILCSQPDAGRALMITLAAQVSAYIGLSMGADLGGNEQAVADLRHELSP